MIHSALAYPTGVVAIASLLAILAVVLSPALASSSTRAAGAVLTTGSLVAGIGGPSALFAGQAMYAAAPLGPQLIAVYGSLGVLSVVAVGITFGVGAISQVGDEASGAARSRWTVDASVRRWQDR